MNSEDSLTEDEEELEEMITVIENSNESRTIIKSQFHNKLKVLFTRICKRDQAKFGSHTLRLIFIILRKTAYLLGLWVFLIYSYYLFNY